MGCSETDGLWNLMPQANGVDRGHHPQEETVRYMKAAFAASNLNRRRKKQQPGNVVDVLFDSSLRSNSVGMRSAGKQMRQMLFRAGPYHVDVQIEEIPDSARLSVTGQLLNASSPGMVGRDAQVTLSTRRGNFVHLVTNEFGEFRGEIENSGDLELILPSRGGKPIIISLRNALG